MNIRYKTLSASPHGVIRAGTVVDVSDTEATALISGGFAEPVGVKANATATVEKIKAVTAPKTVAKRKSSAQKNTAPKETG